MRNIFIYLSGSIKKSHNEKDNVNYWTQEYIILMTQLFKNNHLNAVFLNPSLRSDDLSDELSLFGRDALQVILSDYVLADMREKRGIGIGYEMAIANFKNIPVISWAAKDSNYHQSNMELLGQKLENWTHPFVSQTSKKIVEDLVEAVL